MLELIRLPSPVSIFEPFQEKEAHRSPSRWESGHFHKGRDQLSRRSRSVENQYKRVVFGYMVIY